MIVWREKFIATGLHFAITLLLAAVAATLIFLVWYPDPFQRMIGGAELFLLITGTDLVLGPLLSLIVYDSRKTRLALIVDYTVVGTLQVAALIYGISVMSGARPAYVAFSADRFEIVAAGDLKPKELAAARDPQYATLPWRGPRYVAVVIPREDYQEAMFEALAGNEEPLRPKFYVPYESQLPAVRKRAKGLDVLEAKKPKARALLNEALADVKIPRDELGWLPVRHVRGFWTAVINTTTGAVVAWIDLDPYDD